MDDVSRSNAALELIELIRHEFPEGSNRADVEVHIEKHYRNGVEFEERSWPLTDQEGNYTGSFLDLLIVKACWNPRDQFEGGSLKVFYVTSENVYRHTEVKFVGWKGSSHPEVIRTGTADAPSGCN